MSNHGFKHQSYPARVISREQVEHAHDYAQTHCSLRDYLMVRLFLKTGIRTNELCMLQIGEIDFNSCRFRVFDSKKYEFFPLPLDIRTADLIHELIGAQTSGYVFGRTQSWRKKKLGQPLKPEAVWSRIKKIGLAAGIRGMKPRLFRDYFAAYWHYVKKGNLEVLRQILRHESIEMTDHYVRSMVFQEDIEDEYRRIMDDTASSIKKTETQSEEASRTEVIPAQRR